MNKRKLILFSADKFIRESRCGSKYGERLWRVSQTSQKVRAKKFRHQTRIV